MRWICGLGKTLTFYRPQVAHPPFPLPQTLLKAVMASDLTPPPANESSNPSNPQADSVAPVDNDNPLSKLIGGNMVAGLKQLGLLDGVKVADTSISNFKVINGTNKPFKIIGSNGEEMEIGSIINGSSFARKTKKAILLPLLPKTWEMSFTKQLGEGLKKSITKTILP